jgi:hypothetical protein
MTPREKMFENIVRHAHGHTDMFIMTISMHEAQPVIAGFFEGRIEDGEDEPPSLNIGSQVLQRLHLSMLAGMLDADGNEEYEDEEDDEDGDEENDTRH